ncbi:MAG TPA: hypothetical protein VHI31_07450 [Actinomycetota bacterium]|nr:hypothetical protein [Actinomycetota bacterium]
MTEEAEQTGLRGVGNPPLHADDRPVNQNSDETMGEDEGGLGPRGETANHIPEYSEIQGSRRGGGAAGSAVRSADNPNPQPADE